MKIQINITGLDKVESRLRELGARLPNFMAAMTEIGTRLEHYFSQDVFISRGADFGQPWVSLNPRTSAFKNAHYPGRGILERSGTMRESFYSMPSVSEVYVSNKASYFPYHQLGTSPGAGRGHNIPQREMIGVNPQVESIIQTIIEADVRAKIDSTDG